MQSASNKEPNTMSNRISDDPGVKTLGRACVFFALLMGFIYWTHGDHTTTHTASSSTTHAASSSVPNVRVLEEAAGLGSRMVAELGCTGNWSDDKKKAIFDRDYKNKLTLVSGEVATAGDGNVTLKVLDSTLTFDVHIRMANPGDVYDLVKGQTITVRFVPTQIGGCLLAFWGSEGVIVR
jgi:hypothetical protein